MAIIEFQSQLEYIKYSRDEIHFYSPGVKKLFDLAVSYIYDAEEAYRNGKSAVWTWGLWEGPLVYACDAIPVSYTELGRLGSLDAITVTEDHYQIPREACSMVKATLGEWYLRRDTGIKRILGLGASCEPFYVATELVKKEGYDVHYIDCIYRPPVCDEARYEQIVGFFVDELRDAARWLSGHELDEARLDIEIRRRNGFMRKIRRIMELRLQHPLYIRSLPTMFLLMGSGHYFGKPDEYQQILDLLIEELTNLEASRKTVEKLVPLIWNGGRGQEFGVYQAIDDSGGAILGWVIPTPYARDYREDIPPVESLARYFLDGQTAGASIYKRGIVEEQIRKTGACGMIMYGYVGCSFSGVEREMERKYFQKHGVPSISLDGTFQVGPPTGQLLTRVKAFVEMLSG